MEMRTERDEMGVRRGTNLLDLERRMTGVVRPQNVCESCQMEFVSVWTLRIQGPGVPFVLTGVSAGCQTLTLSLSIRSPS